MLVDDTNCSFLSTNPNALDIVRGLAQSFQLVMDNVRALDGRLGVELCGV